MFFFSNKNSLRNRIEKRYNLVLPYSRKKDVLDIPCGFGYGTSLLENTNSALGIDSSPDAIKDAKKLYPDLKFCLGNMTNIPASTDFFDLIVCLEGIEHISYPDAMLFISETKRCMKKHGKLILTTPLRKNNLHSGNPYHLCEYKEKELFNLINDSGLSIFDYFYFINNKNKHIFLVAEKL